MKQAANAVILCAVHRFVTSVALGIHATIFAGQARPHPPYVWSLVWQHAGRRLRLVAKTARGMRARTFAGVRVMAALVGRNDSSQTSAQVLHVNGA